MIRTPSAGYSHAAAVSTPRTPACVSPCAPMIPFTGCIPQVTAMICGRASVSMRAIFCTTTRAASQVIAPSPSIASSVSASFAAQSRGDRMMTPSKGRPAATDASNFSSRSEAWQVWNAWPRAARRSPSCAATCILSPTRSQDPCAVSSTGSSFAASGASAARARKMAICAIAELASRRLSESSTTSANSRSMACAQLAHIIGCMSSL